MLMLNLVLAVILLVFGFYLLMVAFNIIKTTTSFREDKKKILLVKTLGFVIVLLSIFLIIKTISVL